VKAYFFLHLPDLTSPAGRTSFPFPLAAAFDFTFPSPLLALSFRLVSSKVVFMVVSPMLVSFILEWLILVSSILEYIPSITSLSSSTAIGRVDGPASDDRPLRLEGPGREDRAIGFEGPAFEGPGREDRTAYRSACKFDG
jgi:hypothetical protein